MSNLAAQLTSRILDNTTKVNNYLQAHELPDLSFDTDVPPTVQQDDDFTVPRDAAVEAAEELLALLGGSTRAIFTQKITDLANLQAICRFDIATALPEEPKSSTYDELATSTGLPEPDVRRIVRGSITNHVFKEERSGEVSHTAASRFLANNKLVRQWIEMTATETMPGALNMVNAMSKWPASGEPNEAGWNIAYNTTDICWEYLPKVPERAQVFADAMSVFTAGSAYGPEALLEYVDKNKLHQGTIVDIGGSHGSVSIPIIRQHQDLRCIVQDLPAVIEVAEKNVQGDIKDRVEFMHHDFFTEQPVKNAEIYLMRWILHDWSDKYASKILKALVPAMKKGARLLIHEYIIPEPGKGSATSQLSYRWMDTLIKGLCNGKERDEQDWRALFAAVDSRFVVRALYQSDLSKLGIVDVEWCPEESQK
ncbi:O-methyltransferase-domain-containing protein [Lophiotrema nucula]|uniref:O-methyltransferase-domain-containing protein n=1 Tax=Lophiotrema nucula TaxID=690887 RepID=A0A6A5ZJF9_9PLEO|nr:O-methyltransferase-domain-containing protein [Lophiotrema nucula]